MKLGMLGVFELKIVMLNVSMRFSETFCVDKHIMKMFLHFSKISNILICREGSRVSRLRMICCRKNVRVPSGTVTTTRTLHMFLFENTAEI